MKIYYEDDANIEIIQSMNVTIVGYAYLLCCWEFEVTIKSDDPSVNT